MNIEKKELEGVSVIFYDITPRIQAWADAVTDAGATVYEEGSDGIIALRKHTPLKVAVIIGLTTNETRLQEIVETNEVYFSDPTMSLRYFRMVEKGQILKFSHDKIRPVTYRDMAPNKLPERINISIYKSRLPHFLRTGYDVEICEDLEPFDGNNYKKIIVRSYTGEEGQLNYESKSLYIHNKELYELRDGIMVKIDEGSDVFVRKGKFVEQQDSRFDGHLTLSLLKNSDTEE